MATISKRNRKASLRPSSSQLRYAVIYVLITAIALVFLNIYATSTLRKLAFSAQENSMLDKAQLISTALSSVDSLNSEDVPEIISSIQEVRVTRILVTDSSGLAVYDSLRVHNERGKLMLLPEIVQALSSRDVFHCSYSEGALQSHAAMPVFCGNRMTGAVYLMEYDTEEGAMIRTLQANILYVSLILEAAVILISVVFSATFSGRMRRILQSIRTVREGDYSNKIETRGHDEVDQLAGEFNELTDRLQDYEQKRRQFVSDASHELKTPLASIKLLSDSILQNEMDEETTKEFVTDIGQEADRLTRLSEKLLKLTKIDAGTEEDREIVSVAEVAERVAHMLAPIASLREIQIKTDIAPDCTVMTIEDDLYQILFNLAENGIKYNNDGGLLELSAERDEENVILTVSDTGVGIPEDSLDHIFERFYRVDKARSRAAGGAGLGLSIVHDMVERNYGAILAENRPEGGSKFTVTFPYIPVEVEA